MFKGEYALDGGLHETTKDICKKIWSQLDRLDVYEIARQGIDEAYLNGRSDFKHEVISGLEKAIEALRSHDETKQSVFTLQNVLAQIEDMDSK